MIDIDVNVRKVEDEEGCPCTGEEGCPCDNCNFDTKKPARYNIESNDQDIGLCDLDDDFNISQVEFVELRIKQTYNEKS